MLWETGEARLRMSRWTRRSRKITSASGDSNNILERKRKGVLVHREKVRVVCQRKGQSKLT